jgi:hypothetical protein
MTKRNTYTIGVSIKISVPSSSSSHKLGEWLRFPNMLPILGYIDGRRGSPDHERNQLEAQAACGLGLPHSQDISMSRVALLIRISSTTAEILLQNAIHCFFLTRHECLEFDNFSDEESDNVKSHVVIWVRLDYAYFYGQAPLLV